LAILSSRKGLNAHFGTIFPALKRWAIFGEHGSQARSEEAASAGLEEVALVGFILAAAVD